jgi:uncharacterized protein YegP (UPF0339 family)
MATATQKRRGTRQGDRQADGKRGSGALAFVTFEDNSGNFRWTMLDSDGEVLARSRAFIDYDAAEASAGAVRDATGSAPPERRPA